VLLAATTFEWAQLLTAATAVVIAALVAVMPYARRPKLSIEEDHDRSNSRVEQSQLGGLPHVRLLVTNGKRRRAAQNARVLIEGYTVLGSHQPALDTLGHPSLQWPSASAEVVTTATEFGGGARPITLGYFMRVRRDANDDLHYVRESDYRPGEADAWYLKLAIGIDINDNRDKLPPYDDGYVVRLLVGADDGAARSFTVHLDWDGDPDLRPDEVLRSALGRLAVLG
jgi:hypothetical protein